jgi:transglutaminase-like putative cysteine protease
VGVSYVWRADYDGIDFPAKRTRVLRLRAPNRATYWRATTLDSFADDHWGEDLTAAFPPQDGTRADFSQDELALMPAAARDREDWLRADVTVEALRDHHLVGPSVPVAYDTRDLPPPQFAAGGVAFVPRVSERGDEYTAWGYAPRPKPSELSHSPADYPSLIRELGAYRSVERGVFPPLFGAPNRAEWARDEFAFNSRMRRYEPLYREAVRLAGNARNPYAATVALEAWFRTGGGFTYDEHPPPSTGAAPLTFFVTESKTGYCQHFAGAMALMLRYLGIPARVAAGFTSGVYNRERLEWTVNDRNAHTWVEVWFKGYGWLPFDPTPGQGNLSGPYSASSFTFDAGAARAVLLGSGLAAADRLLRFQLDRQRSANGQDISPRDPKGAGGAGGSDDSTVGPAQIVIALLIGLALLAALAKLAWRRSRFLTRDPRRVAAACRQEIVDFLADQRIDVPPSASLQELRALLDEQTGVDPRRFVEAVGAARYGPLPSAAPAAHEARSELRTVRKRLRAALTRWERVRGTFSLRSALAG